MCHGWEPTNLNECKHYTQKHELTLVISTRTWGKGNRRARRKQWERKLLKRQPAESLPTTQDDYKIHVLQTYNDTK